jgi:O-antigen/teichoic acid export membrane protein
VTATVLLQKLLPPQRYLDATLALAIVAFGVLVAGAILAVATVRYAQPWVHWASFSHGRDR